MRRRFFRLFELFQVIRIVFSVARIVALSLFWLVLGGCASNLSAAYDMYRSLDKPDPNRFQFFEGSSDLVYLEVHSATSQALLVLGYVTSPKGQPEIQTWYDSNKELLRLQNGLLVSVTGVSNAITEATYVWPTPGDSKVPRLPSARTYSQPSRQLFNKSVQLSYQPVDPHAVDLGKSLLRKRLLGPGSTHGNKLVWYSEGHGMNQGLYAWTDQGEPVYGFFCLTREECVEWLFKKQGVDRP